MKNTLFGKVLSSGLQAIAVQVLGGIFFIFISLYLSKDYFGILNWANAVAVVFTMLLSFGLDQVVVRRIAASERSDWAAAAYLFHAFTGSFITFLILFGISMIPSLADAPKMQILPWLFLSQGLLYTAGPLKQLLNAKQNFRPYALIAIISNVAKLVLAYVLVKTQTLSISGVMTILVSCGAFELVALLVYVLGKMKFNLSFKKVAYFKLIKEALPQYIAVMFDSSLARMDWILLGILSTPAASAEYGLAYRAYEIAKLPLTVISPIILARCAKMLTANNKLTADTQLQVKDLYRVELFFATMIPLLLNILWSPVLDHVFDGKYGSVNALSFMVLSICIPFQFFINILWTLSFAAKKYKENSTIIASTAVINIVLNIVLIPVMGGNGAAIAFLVTSALQVVGYFLLIRKHIMTFSFVPFFSFLIIAITAYFAAIAITGVVWLQCIVAMLLYIIVSILLKQIQKKHLSVLFTLLKK